LGLIAKGEIVEQTQMISFVRNLIYSVQVDREFQQLVESQPQETQERLRIQNQLIRQGYTIVEAQHAYDEMMGNGKIWQYWAED
jgi:SOS response regulatory protein OraA/RecX